MLYLIGLGLKPDHITIEALAILKKCEKVYVEAYTSQYSEGTLDNLEDLIGKATTSLDRQQIEEGFSQVLDEAKTKEIALGIFGNPMNATTHLQIILDAKKEHVNVKIIPGLSVFELVSFTGLERYKFGKTTSIVFHEDNFEPESFYDAIVENKKLGLHTLCLLDIKKDEEKLMSISHAVTLLERIELQREQNVLNDSIFIGLSGLSSNNEQIKAGSMEQLKKINFSVYPQSLIVCGKLNEKEVEGLKELSDLI